MYHSVINLGPRAFSLPIPWKKGPRNEVDSVLFGSATSMAIYFFCLLSNAFPDFGSVGRSVGN